MFRLCIVELTTWFRAILESIPGEIGCFLRRRFYRFTAGANNRVLGHVTIYYLAQLVMGKNVGVAAYTQINAGGGIKFEIMS
jgi:hypothetical protein